jgi:hypothetical protein
MRLISVLLVLFSIGSLFAVASPYTPSQGTSTTTTSTITTYTALGITVSTDKSTYSSGETVVVSGTVTGVGYLCGSGTTCTFTSNIIVGIEVWDPLNKRVHSSSLSLYPPSLPDELPIRSYNDSFALSSDLTSGTFQVNVYADWNGSTAYARSSFRLEGTASTGCGQWVVATDKQEYVAGETVHMTGYAGTSCMTFGWGTTPVIRLSYSSGSLDIRGQATYAPGGGGSYFYADWQIPSTFSSGTVAITVFDPTMPNIAAGATTFIITTAGTLGNLSVNFDKTTYYAGEVVHIAGDFSQLIRCTMTYWEVPVTITIYRPDGSLAIQSTTNNPAAKGYAFDYALPGDAMIGSYTVTVTYSGGLPCSFGTPPAGQGTFQVLSTTPVTTAPCNCSFHLDTYNYNPGQTIHIVIDYLGSYTIVYPTHFVVHVHVYDPMQREIGHDDYYVTWTTATTVTEFSHEFDWTIPVNASLGIYTIRGTAGNCPEFSTQFQVAAITTPYTGGAVPGFQLESVLAGLLVGITVLMLFRRRSKQNDKQI